MNKEFEKRFNSLEQKVDKMISMLFEDKTAFSEKTEKRYPKIGSEEYWNWIHHDRKNNLSDDFREQYDYFDEEYLKNNPVTRCLVWFDFDEALEVCDKMNYRYGLYEIVITLKMLEQNALDCLKTVYQSFCQKPGYYDYQLGRIHAYAIDYGFDENTHEDAFIVTDDNGNKHELILKLSFEIEDSTNSPY